MAKTNAEYIAEGLEVYKKRIDKYISFEYLEITALKNTKNFSNEQIKQEESKLFEKYLPNIDCLVLLDEQGKQFTSPGFAHFLQQCMNKGNKNVGFLVGGAYGFSPQLYQKAHIKVSLSMLTFSHQLVRLLFFEQLYRAFTILNNEPYHHA